MAGKRYINSVLSEQHPEMSSVNKYITALQKVASTNFDGPKEQLERRSTSGEQGDSPHPATDAYNLLHCLPAKILSGIPDNLPSGNLALLAPSFQGEIFIIQITGDIYTYD